VDYNPDLKRIDVPTLIVHGDDDQIVPIADSSMFSASKFGQRKSRLSSVYDGNERPSLGADYGDIVPGVK
jgi:pimeloyl-ACP methyl ester carboxylesterase